MRARGALTVFKEHQLAPQLHNPVHPVLGAQGVQDRDDMPWARVRGLRGRPAPHRESATGKRVQQTQR
jgi:hypothetical protein